MTNSKAITDRASGRAALARRGLLALAAIGTLALLGACASLAGSGRTLTIFLSGDTRGYLQPCGCRNDQAGGVGARATLVADHKTDARLLLDVGNLTSGSSPHDLLKLRYLLTSMDRMGYDAANLGARDVNLGKETLMTALREVKVPFVSCNVLDSQSGKPLVEPYLQITAVGRRIGITGVVEPDSATRGAGLTVRPVLEALAEAVPALRERCDTLIVLAFAKPDTLRQIAERFHEIDYLFGGDVLESSHSAERIGHALCMNVGQNGKILGRLVLERDGEALELKSSEAIKVSDKIPPDKDIARLLDEYRAELRRMDLAQASANGMLSAGLASSQNRYVGDAACVGCHADVARVTQKSAHIHAFETLQKKHSEFDPDCLKCHTVGFGARSGFVNMQRTPHLAGVQCESCHGRGKLHVDAMRAGTKAPSSLQPVTPNSCVRCHDKENSENFRFETYWPKIAHGKPKSP